MQQTFREQIEKFLQTFVELSPLQKCQFPILPITYSLWRKVCYQKFSEKRKNLQNKQQLNQLNKAFFQISERKILPSFLKRIRQQMDGRTLGWKRALQQQEQLKLANNEQYQELILQYSEAIYIQQLYLELFTDLVNIPYIDIYDPNAIYKINPKFGMNFYKRKNKNFIDKACNSVGKNILTKSLMKVSEKILSKSVLYSISGLFGAVNPLMMAASFSISLALQKRQKNEKINDITQELKILKQQTLNDVKQLEQIYQKCLCSIQNLFNLDKQQKQKEKIKLKGLLNKIIIQDWLQIKLKKEGQWQVVQLTTKQSYDFVEIEPIQPNDDNKAKDDKN